MVCPLILYDGRIKVRKWFQLIIVEKRYLSIVFIIFVVSAFSGYFHGEEIFRVMQKQGVLKSIEDIAKAIHQNPNFIYAFMRIFLNNLMASFSMIFFGLFLGLIPLFSMLTNGMMLGMMIKVAANSSGQNPWWIFVTTILPHGIFEIPAILLSAAYGVHLGIALLRRIGCVFFPHKLEKSKQEWQQIRQQLPVVMITVVVLLLIAALIEAGLIIYLM